jgi:predicted nuclease of predicted toxin-antitoxin system
MRFKLDENVPLQAVDVFEDAGHDVETVFSENMVGESDPNIAEVVRDENRVLVTLDTDFGDIRTYPPEEYPGFLVLRPRQSDLDSVVSLLEETLPLVEQQFEPESLWIVEEEQIRVRE